jgi:hypothetical protein
MADLGEMALNHQNLLEPSVNLSNRLHLWSL